VTSDLFPGITDPDERRRLERRHWLEQSVQSLVGPIANIAEIDTPALYGIRDGAFRKLGQKAGDLAA
jgi:hypothetical protein